MQVQGSEFGPQSYIKNKKKTSLVASISDPKVGKLQHISLAFMACSRPARDIVLMSKIDISRGTTLKVNFWPLNVHTPSPCTHIQHIHTHMQMN